MSDPNLTGDFVIFLYNCGYVNENRVDVKEIIQQYLPAYQKLHSNETINSNVLLTQLLQSPFVNKSQKNGSTELIRSSILKYRNNMINELDKQLQEKVNKKPRKQDNMQTIVSSKEKVLEFQLNQKQCGSREMKIAGVKCFRCSASFLSYTELWNHISSHLNGTTLDWRATMRLLLGLQEPTFRVSYKQFQSSLRISVDCRPFNDVKIVKILIIDRQKFYFQRDFSKETNSNPLHIDVQNRYFNNDYEFPCIIVYDQHRTRFMEIYKFPIMKTSLETLTIENELPDYLPTEAAKMFHEGKTHSQFLIDHLKNGRSLTKDNICDIFTLLVEMEDWATSKVYKQFNRSAVPIHYSKYDEEDGYEYYVQVCSNQKDEISQILSVGDQIILIRPGNKIFRMITDVINDRAFFTVKKELELNIFDIAFLPQRMKIKYQHEALNYIRKNEFVRIRLFPRHLNVKMPVLFPRLNFFNSSLAENLEQREAVENIVANTNGQCPFILFGPPGTGKTTVIVETILQLVNIKRENRILVTAGSNAACDEIAIRLIEHFSENELRNLAMLRIYAQSCDRKSINKNLIQVSNIERRKQYYPSLKNIYRYRVVIATLTVVGRLVHAKISNEHFTHVFIDECGSTMEPESLLGICGIVSLSSNLILAGDPKQLGPIVNCSKAATYGLDRSLLERLLDQDCYKVDASTKGYNTLIQIRLRKNYRCHPAILSLSNQMYYDNQLQALANSKIAYKAIGWPSLKNKSFPVLFMSVKGAMQQRKNSTSYFNQEEIDLVMGYVKDLMFYGILNQEIRQEDIGIISPYKMQCNLLRKELDKRGWYRIITGSVETFQGQERSIIIASTVRSRIKSHGFLNNPKRLNVLLTRAQSLLIIVGNSHTLYRIGDWKHLVDYCFFNKAIFGDPPAISDDNLSQRMKKMSISTVKSTIDVVKDSRSLSSPTFSDGNLSQRIEKLSISTVKSTNAAVKDSRFSSSPAFSDGNYQQRMEKLSFSTKKSSNDAQDSWSSVYMEDSSIERTTETYRGFWNDCCIL